MEKLSEDDSWRVRRHVAKNPNTPVSVLKKLAKDEDEDVRYLVAGNANTPVSVLEKLAEDEKKIFKQLVDNTEDSFDFRNLADSICERLGDKELLKEVYKKWEGKAEDRYDFRYLADSLIKNIGDKEWAKKLYIKEKNSTEEMIPIDLISLKSAMDDDGDIIFEDDDFEEPYERLLLMRTGAGVESEYLITVERATREKEGEGEEDEDEEEYVIIGTYRSSLNEIKDAVQCFLDEGGSLNSFAEYKL